MRYSSIELALRSSPNRHRNRPVHGFNSLFDIGTQSMDWQYCSVPCVGRSGTAFKEKEVCVCVVYWCCCCRGCCFRLCIRLLAKSKPNPIWTPSDSHSEHPSYRSCGTSPANMSTMDPSLTASPSAFVPSCKN